MVFDWSGLVRRHPAQVMSEAELRPGEAYVEVHACSVRGLMVTEYVYFGLFDGDSLFGIGSRIRNSGWAAANPATGRPPYGFTLHADGWVGDDRDRLDTPSRVSWNGDRFCSYSSYRHGFGLDDLLAPDHADNIQHYIMVPKDEWDRNPMRCDFDRAASTDRAPANGGDATRIETKHRRGRDALLASIFG